MFRFRLSWSFLFLLFFARRTVEVEEFERLKENMRMQGGKEVTEKFEGVQGEGTVLQPDRRNVEKVR